MQDVQLYSVQVTGKMYVLAKSKGDAENVASRWLGEETAVEFNAEIETGQDGLDPDELGSIPWGGPDGPGVRSYSVEEWITKLKGA